MERAVFSWWFARRVALLTGAAVLFGCVLSVVLAMAVTGGGGPAWSSPGAMAVRRASQTIGSQGEPGFLDNLDCTPLTYRQAATTTMRSGCFTETAFGLFDSDSSTAIFNGTDEGLPLLPHTAHQILAPWPKALDLVSLDPVDTGGTLISLYKNPLVALHDQRNAFGQITGKQLAGPPDVTLKDLSGKPLVVNPQSVAFSAGGAWLVAETLGGSFVRINLASLSMTAFARAYGSQGSPALFQSRVAITEDGRFVAIANDIAGEFKVYDLDTCDGVVNNLKPQSCRSYDYQSFVRQRIEKFQFIKHLRFVNDGLVSFDAYTGEPADNGLYELAPTASITSLTDYIGLGDSYSSGEGAFDYLEGTDTPDDMCHLSRNSYPLLLAHDLFGAAGGHSVACSGARIRDVGSVENSYRGQVRNAANLEGLQAAALEAVEANFLPGYVAQQRFIGRWQPRAATVSIGGNDIGFGDILQKCVEPHLGAHGSDNTCYSSYEDRLEVSRLIDRTVPRWTALFEQLRREAPDMRLYAIGYPQVAAADGDCAANVHLNKSELGFAAATIAYLDQSIRKAAAAAGVPYVDISDALDGHRLCEAASYSVAVNGLTAGTDAGLLGVNVFGKESYHPNALGQQLIEQAILRQTDNLSGGLPAIDPADTAGPVLLDAPPSGRPVYTVVPDDTLTAGVARSGSTIRIQVDGIADGLRPFAPYIVHLDGPGGTTLGTILADDTGSVQGEVTIPAATPPGSHSIDIVGDTQDNGSADVTQMVYTPDRDVDNAAGNEVVLYTNTLSTSSSPDASSPRPMGSSSGQALGATAPFSGKQPGAKITHYSPGTRRPSRLGTIIGLALLALTGICIQKIKHRLQWCYMNRVRKGFVYLLSLFLLATLIGAAVSTSSNNTLGKPKKVEQYLAESKLYDHFIAYTTDQAKKSNGDTDLSGSVSLSDAAVQSAAQQAFPPSLIQQSINTFINSNYAWLQGKTATPQFKIDLSQQKQTFAEKVGQHVTTYTATLPECANDAVALQQSQDPLSATCRPQGTTPEAIGQEVTERLSQTGDFLSNPVITPDSVNPRGNPQSKPYYVKLAHLPKAYRLGQKMPYILGGLSILFALGIIFISAERRRGLRKVGIVLLIAGVGLVVLKFSSDAIFRHAENHVFNTADVGQLQRSLTDFAHRIEMSMVRTELWFGIGYILLGAIIFGALAGTRNKDGKPSKKSRPADEEEKDDDNDDADQAPIILARKRLERPAVKDLTPRARPGAEAPPKRAPKKHRKPPRLIQ